MADPVVTRARDEVAHQQEMAEVYRMLVEQQLTLSRLEDLLEHLVEAERAKR